MIRLLFTVDNISTVILIYDQIQIQRSSSESGVFSYVDGVGPVLLNYNTSNYSVTDATGLTTDWYRSRYYSSDSGIYSEWSSPILGESGEIFYNPLYPTEATYGASQKMVIDRIRKLIGDNKTIKHEYGEPAVANVHQDSITFELPNKGWPASVIMNGAVYNSIINPSVNDYKYLIFNDYIGDICYNTVTYSGCCATDNTKVIPEGIDIWYYTFRHSDKEIMEAYNVCPIPYPLTANNANSEVCILQTAIDLIHSELLMDSIEDGAHITDENTSYNPSIGLEVRRKLLNDLQSRLDKLIKKILMSNISGVLID